jgi:hypothetical protein
MPERFALSEREAELRNARYADSPSQHVLFTLPTPGNAQSRSHESPYSRQNDFDHFFQRQNEGFEQRETLSQAGNPIRSNQIEGSSRRRRMHVSEESPPSAVQVSLPQLIFGLSPVDLIHQCFVLAIDFL